MLKVFAAVTLAGFAIGSPAALAAPQAPALIITNVTLIDGTGAATRSHMNVRVENGRIVDIAILDHAVDPMFDEETLNTVRGWRYRPMIVNGKPVEVVHEVEVNYQYIVR